MNKRRTVVNTSSRQIYEQLNLLHFTEEVILNNIQPRAIGKLFANINKDKQIITKQVIGNIIKIKKHQPLDIQVYLR